MQLHLCIQILVVVGTAGGLTLGLIIGSGEHTAHKTLGIIIAAIVGYQFIAGMCRPGVGAPRRALWNAAHHWPGRAALVIAWVNFGFGIVPFNHLAGAVGIAATSSFGLAYVGPAIATFAFLCECKHPHFPSSPHPPEHRASWACTNNPMIAVVAILYVQVWRCVVVAALAVRRPATGCLRLCGARCRGRRVDPPNAASKKAERRVVTSRYV